ncbi:MAG: YfhO family protein [Candidatus Margulisiibacteriota bacterium]
MRIEKNDLLACLAFFVLTLIFFLPFLKGSQIIAFKDLSRYFYPLRQLMVEQVKMGQFPLWNPYIFCGFPLLATLQICFFYPLSIIHYFLPYNLAFNYYTILHYFLAASFMYWLLRYFRLVRPAAFLGGIVFAFSGYLLSVSNMNTSLSSVIWLPLILIFFDRLLKDKSFANIAILGILLAVQFLGGEPTIIYVTLFFLLAYGGVFAGSWRAFGRSLLGLGLAGLTALGLVAVQLLPFLELAKYSDRVVRTAYEIVAFRSFPPRELINFIFPYFFGNPAQFGGFTETLVGKTFQDWLISPYLGVLPLVFVFMSFGKNKKAALFFAVTAVAALLLAFGKYTPIYRLVYLVPGVSMIRYPVKYLFLLTFCLAILSSFGFDWLLSCCREGREKLRWLLRIFVPILGVMSLLFVVVCFFRRQIFAFFASGYSANLPKYFFGLLASIIEFNLLTFFFIICYLLAFVLLLFFAYRQKIKVAIFALLLILLVTADLFANSSTIMVAVAADVFAQAPQTYKLLQRETGLYRFFYTPELEKGNRLILGEDYNDALFEAKDNLTANWHIPYHFFDFYGYESIKPMGLFKYYHENFKEEKTEKNLKFLSRYNVKYIAATKKLGTPFLKLLRHKRKYGLDVYLYENASALPRAYILYPNKPAESQWKKVEIVKYSSQEIIISAGLRVDGRLFLSDSFYPGWKAYVDGTAAPIDQEAEYFRSVKLSPGKHLVRFVYDPLSFKIGALISLMTIFGLLWGGFISFRKNK